MLFSIEAAIFLYLLFALITPKSNNEFASTEFEAGTTSS